MSIAARIDGPCPIHHAPATYGCTGSHLPIWPTGDRNSWRCGGRSGMRHAAFIQHLKHHDVL